MDLSVVVPTIRPRSEIEVVEYLDRCSFEDYEVIIREDVPVTKARNEGYNRAKADKILFLDDDSMPRDGYLRAASKTLETEAAVAGRTIHPKDDVFADQLTAHYDFGDEPRYVERFWGCNMGVRREVLDAVGGWDDDMGWGHEEKELAERLLREHCIYYDPQMIVDHVYADSLPDFWKKRYKLEKGTPYYLRKQGASRDEIVFKTLSYPLNPLKYLGHTPELTIARVGNRVAGTAGRFAGLFDLRSTIDDTCTNPT
jgi:glycosyltransferase involved in cell wall biosynthesis